MKNWFFRFTPREQLSLLLVAALVGVYVLYFFVWSPIATKRDDMALRNQATSESLYRVDTMVSEVLRLRADGANVSRKRNLTSVINQSARRLDLPVSRMQPNSRGEIQVRMENAIFDNVLKWLHEMEYSEGLLVREVSITPAGTEGRANASVRIAQGS